MLAFVVVCCGCFMLFAFALTARSELQASVLGSDWRVWQLQGEGTNGIGVSQTGASTSGSGQACRTTRVWLITWRPRLQIEAKAYDECDTAHAVPVAPASHSAIIDAGGGDL